MTDDIGMMIPTEAVRYVLFQRTCHQSALFKAIYKLSPFPIYNRVVALESFFRSASIKRRFARDIETEYKDIANALPKKCSSILDIGCGVAGIDVLLFRHFKHDPSLMFHLLDKSAVDSRVFYGFKQQGSIYNSLEVARRLLVANGIPVDRIHLQEATDNNTIEFGEQFDLVTSLISWGFHYPVPTYLDQVDQCMRPGAHLILDVRKGTDGQKLINDRFGDVKTISESDSKLRLLVVK